jgi:hypothetical protein
MLCCGSSLERSNAVGQFLDYPLDEIQRMRRMKSLCGKCMKLGIPDYFEGTSPYFEAIAKETIAGWTHANFPPANAVGDATPYSSVLPKSH